MQKREERRERRRALRRRQRQHYEKGSHWGRPASSLLYELARHLVLEDAHLLWWVLGAAREAAWDDSLGAQVWRGA